MFDNFHKLISKSDLKSSKKEDLIRLAKFIGLHVENDWSVRHLAKLIYWRLSRRIR